MKRVLWVLAISVILLVVLVISSSVVVYATAGIDGLGAYTLALRAVVDIAKSAFEAMASIVTASGNTVIELFKVAVE